MIRFGLPKAVPIDVRVVDLRGRTVFAHTETLRAAGYHRLRLPSERMSRGEYVLVFTAGQKTLRSSLLIAE